MADSSTEIVTLPDAPALAREAARQFAGIAQDSIANRGVFRVALSGGSTPKALYQILSAYPYREEVRWDNIQIFFSDERFVPPDSDQSNFHTANVGLLTQVPIPGAAVHPVPTIDIAPSEAATLYEGEIRRAFGVADSDTPQFDLIFLGLGPDGHTASLFPETDALSDRKRLVASNYVPRLDSWRITFTYTLLNAGHTVMFLVQGQDKAQRVAEVMSRRGNLPAAGVQPDNGHLIWMLDAAAASQLDTTESIA